MKRPPPWKSRGRRTAGRVRAYLSFPMGLTVMVLPWVNWTLVCFASGPNVCACFATARCARLRSADPALMLIYRTNVTLTGDGGGEVGGFGLDQQQG